MSPTTTRLEETITMTSTESTTLQMRPPGNNSATEADDHDSNGVKIVANTATDVKPDATPRTDCETRIAI